MILTKEKLYQLIQEELIQEAAKGIQDIPEGVYVTCATLKNKNGFVISLKAKGAPQGYAIGWIQFEKIPNEKGNCSGGMTISMSKAEAGWGPFLYDLVMEKATIESSGIIPDRTIVSKSARGVWQYYLDTRKGILVRGLDDLEDSNKNGPHDDCVQDSSQKHLGPDWKESPLSRIYSKKPTTIETLKNFDPPKWLEIEL